MAARLEAPEYTFDTATFFGDPATSPTGDPPSCGAADAVPPKYLPEVPGVRDPETGEMSISFWFWAHHLERPVQSLVSKGNALVGRRGWHFFVENDGAGNTTLVFRVRAIDRTQTPAKAYNAAVSKAIRPGRWYHVVGVIDRQLEGETDPRNQVRLYLNEETDPFISGGGGAASAVLGATPEAEIDSDQPLRIGWTNPSTNDHNCTSGIVRHLAIYPRALSFAGEITQLYDEYPTLHYEPISDIPGQLEKDGVLETGSYFKHFSEREFGDPDPDHDPVCSKAIVENPAYNYPTSKAIEENPVAGETSISFWFYARDFRHSVHSLVSKGNAVSTHGGWRFFVEDGKLIFRVGGKDPATGQRVSAGTSKPVVPGRWYHVVGVIYRTNPQDEVRLYLNDEFAPQSGGGGAPTRFFTRGSKIETPQPLRIGWTRNPDNDVHQCSNGKLTGLRIYRRALSHTEIDQLFDAEPPMKTDQVLFDPKLDRKNVDFDSFRIPSLVRTPEGYLLAFAEGRVCSHVDHSESNLVYKRSTDGGLTWTPLREVWGATAGTWADPTAVTDFTNRRVWLFMTHTEPNVSNPGGKQNPCDPDGELTIPGNRHIYVTWSDDDGWTWAPPAKANNSNYKFQPLDDDGKLTEIWDHVGPGVGVQIQPGHPKAGRLIVPALDRHIYSDDHGDHWNFAYFEKLHTTSESTVVELSDGSLLRNDRAGTPTWLTGQRRWTSVGTSSESGFEFLDFFQDPYLIDPRVEGSSLLYSTTPWRILFMNPAHVDPLALDPDDTIDNDRRCNMTVRMSYDDGNEWPVARALHEQDTPSATCAKPKGGYSSMATTGYVSMATATPEVKGDPSAIGALSELDPQGNSGDYRIEFHHFNFPWLLSEPQ